MAVKSGDFLLVNYTLKVKESGETVDTTFDSVAKDAHIHREDSTFGPKFIILGEGWLPKGLNLIALRIPEVPKEKFALRKHQSDLTIEVPEEAFYLSGLQVAKKAVTSDLQKFFPDIDTVAFQEVFKRSEPKPELPATGARPAEVTPEKEEKAEAEPESAPKKPKSPAKKKGAAAKKPSASTSRKRAKMGSENQR